MPRSFLIANKRYQKLNAPGTSQQDAGAGDAASRNDADVAIDVVRDCVLTATVDMVEETDESLTQPDLQHSDSENDDEINVTSLTPQEISANEKPGFEHEIKLPVSSENDKTVYQHSRYSKLQPCFLKSSNAPPKYSTHDWMKYALGQCYNSYDYMRSLYPTGTTSAAYYRTTAAFPRQFLCPLQQQQQKPQTTDINFNHLNQFVDKVFDGLRVCDVYTCSQCGKQYSTPSNLARHKQIHRDMSDKKARKCPHCEKVYVSMPAFSMHVRTHNEGCACPYCGKRFSRPWLLQGHIRTHTGEKPFRCTLCTKAFADKSNLRAHVQTHSSEKPHVCGRCGKAFALKSYLSKHEESSCMKGLKFKISCSFSARTN